MPDTSSVSAPRWRRRSDARPAEIAEAALSLFAEAGFSATSVSAIARRAGVTKGTVYLYFESKEDLFLAAVRGRTLPMIEGGEALAQAFTGTSADLIRQLFEKWFAVLRADAHVSIPRLVMAEATAFPTLARHFVEEIVQRGRSLFAGAIRRGIAAGEFRPVDPDVAARLATAPLIYAALHQTSYAPFDAPLDLDLYLSTHIDLFLGGLRAGTLTSR